MKKVLVLLSIVASIVMIGCGDGSSPDVNAGGKAPKAAAPAAKKKSGAGNGLADMNAVPAPPGVKTGTPGG